MSLQLLVVDGPDASKVFTIQAGPDLMLGRGQQCLYHLNDPRVSRAHCQVLLEGEQAVVIDNGGSGGTLVNGVPVKRQALKLGDVVHIGDTDLRLQLGDFPLDVALAAIQQAGTAPKAPAAKDTDQLAALSGQTLAHYEIGPVLGKGHLGMVFQAQDVKDGKKVALKVLQPEFAKDEEEIQRFIRAVKTMLPMRHPNLVALYGAGKTGAHCWIAMEFIDGESLTEVIQRIGVAGMLDWKKTLRVALDVARALAFAHGQHIVHRNVTPANILLQKSDQTAKLGDLMLAKALDGVLAQQLTRPGELVGAVEYMSPERTRGTQDIDGRADIYGLGATLYALLTGRPPFAGQTLVETITRIRQSEPVKPTKYQMSINGLFEAAVLKMLAKRPEDRFQSAAELVAELERIGKMH
jgi:serine/threonine protein kinase